MNDDKLIDQIVRHVMERLQAADIAAHSDRSRSSADVNAPKHESGVVIQNAVITADVLEKQANGSKRIHVGPRSILTPSAHDFLRSRKIEWHRSPLPSAADRSTATRWRAFVVAANPAVEGALADARRTHSTWDRQLFGCWREAADGAVAAICRAEVDGAVLFCRETAAAACRANRNHRIRAAAAGGVAEIRAVQASMSANVYCVDPSDRGMFDLRNILREVAAVPPHAPAGWKE